MATAAYSPAFYASHEEESYRSALRAVPHVLRLVGAGSVVDIGCGIGTWLDAFRHHGVETTVGVDGAYVPLDQLRIPRETFVAQDLTQPLVLPAHLPQHFDLAVSLEVGEHLPPNSAGQLVATCTALAPAVLFSAAIPHQGGTDHLNEQWPTYWARLFEARGYVSVDALRPLLWGDDEVAYYYAQNALLYVEQRRLKQWPHLAPFATTADSAALNRVHPHRWEEAHDPRDKHLFPALGFAARTAGHVVARRWRRLLGRPDQRIWY